MGSSQEMSSRRASLLATDWLTNGRTERQRHREDTAGHDIPCVRIRTLSGTLTVKKNGTLLAVAVTSGLTDNLCWAGRVPATHGLVGAAVCASERWRLEPRRSSEQRCLSSESQVHLSKSRYIGGGGAPPHTLLYCTLLARVLLFGRHATGRHAPTDHAAKRAASLEKYHDENQRP